MRAKLLESRIERLDGFDGTPNEASIGTPASYGCIRMRNADVIELFDSVQVGIRVEIIE
jgi:lipoprotein-anchoring transpeptidase ErfK/SrfK